VLAAAALSCAAALIHVSVAPAHFEEYWGFGSFFLTVAVLQLAWAEMIRRGDAGRGLLIAGAVGNIAVALIWALSRTVGLPLGPDSGQAEGIGLHDLLATLDELVIALLVGAVLLPALRRLEPVLVPGAWVLAAVSFVGAFLGGHGHN